jgi:hypothetical protein
MKTRIISLLTVIALILALAACGQASQEQADNTNAPAEGANPAQDKSTAGASEKEPAISPKTVARPENMWYLVTGWSDYYSILDDGRAPDVSQAELDDIIKGVYEGTTVSYFLQPLTKEFKPTFNSTVSLSDEPNAFENYLNDLGCEVYFQQTKANKKEGIVSMTFVLPNGERLGATISEIGETYIKLIAT